MSPRAFLILSTLAGGAALALTACSAPDPGFVAPATRGHSGVIGSTGGSGSGSGGSGTSGGGSGGHAATGGGSGGGAVVDGGGLADDGSAPASAATYGTACASNTDCVGNAYNSCQLIQQKMICTKPCTVAADCPAPPTGGTCNTNGYCK
jgi:hypothetical protein